MDLTPCDGSWPWAFCWIYAYAEYLGVGAAAGGFYVWLLMAVRARRAKARLRNAVAALIAEHSVGAPVCDADAFELADIVLDRASSYGTAPMKLMYAAR